MCSWAQGCLLSELRLSQNLDSNLFHACAQAPMGGSRWQQSLVEMGQWKTEGERVGDGRWECIREDIPSP